MPFKSLAKPTQLSTEVAEAIEAEIANGRFSPGDKLPSETQLANAFGVSRNVVREAIAGLKSQGLVETQQGRGAFVLAKCRPASFSIDRQEFEDREQLRKMLELRLEVEVSAAGMAARRRTREQLAEIERSLALLADEDFAEERWAFNRAIAAASGNEYFARLMGFLAEQLGDRLLEPMSRPHLEECREIAQAIREGDPDRARRAAWRHLLNVAARLGLRGVQGWEESRMSSLGENYAPPCAPADPEPRRPRLAVPAGSCDCHAHVFFDERRYPFTPHRSYTPPPASLQSYLQMRETLGLERSVLVQPSVYGTDNRALLEALAAGGESFRGVVVIDPRTPESELQRMHAMGVRGVRINLLFKSGVEVSDVRSLAERVAPFGWHLQLLIDVSEFSDLQANLGRLPVPVVIDHFGHLPTHLGVGHPGFQQLLALAQEGRAWIKLSGAERITTEAYPYADVAPFAKAALAAAPEQLLWASDWPHTSLSTAMPNDGDLLDLLGHWCDDRVLQQQILVDNPARLYGF